MSLAEATGYGSLEITYDGVNESDVYNEGSYYSITQEAVILLRL